MSWQKNGFAETDADVSLSIDKLNAYLDSVPAIFKQFSPDEILLRPAPHKWSRQEILGHLIDSAINNLKRFTEIQFSEQLYRVISYQQDDLVIVNNYQQLPLDHLLNLWKALNQQIIYVVKNIPAEKLSYAVDPQYENREMKTLGWIICDYVSHLEHHLHQVTNLK